MRLKPRILDIAEFRKRAKTGKYPILIYFTEAQFKRAVKGLKIKKARNIEDLPDGIRTRFVPFPELKGYLASIGGCPDGCVPKVSNGQVFCDCVNKGKMVREDSDKAIQTFGKDFHLGCRKEFTREGEIICSGICYNRLGKTFATRWAPCRKERYDILGVPITVCVCPGEKFGFGPDH